MPWRTRPPGSLVEVELAPPARITVLDRGPGVPEAERTAIFERFRRGQAAGAGGAGPGPGHRRRHRRGASRLSAGPGRDGGGAAFVLELGTVALSRQACGR